MLFLLVAFHILVSIGLIVLILMHSGREGGLGGLGFTPTSHGGTHIVERMLTRYTIALAVIWFVDTVALFRLLK
jgi:preprotein translocase subunit SecG